MKRLVYFIIVTLFAAGLTGCDIKAPQFSSEKAKSSYFKSSKRQELIATLRNKGVKIFQIGDKLRIILPSDCFFQPNTATLKPSRVQTLAEIAALVRGYGDVAVYVSGYTDNVATQKHNKKFSYEQAEAIASYLWAHGVKYDDLRVAGYGEKKTVASNRTPLGSAYNRRVEIRLR